ncbi:zinc finger protein, MYND-type [Pelomyxa schiedti]|nr:zinc finger protein, MYND-type [Pelomyxa schiedti]
MARLLVFLSVVLFLSTSVTCWQQPAQVGAVTVFSRDVVLAEFDSIIGKHPKVELGTALAAIPLVQALIYPNSESVSWSGDQCFNQVTSQLQSDMDGITKVDITFHKAKTLKPCRTKYLFACGPIFTIAEFTSVENQTYSIVLLNETSSTDFGSIKLNGVGAFSMLTNNVEWLEDLLATVQLFLGQNQTAILDFLSYYMHIPEIPRENLKLDPSYFQAGDVITTWRLTRAIGAFDMWGTGGYSSHSALVLDLDGSLFVVESTDPVTVSTPLATWLDGEGPNPVGAFRLTEEYQNKFDNDKAVARWKELEGLKYGYSTFIFGWIDTLDQNYPLPFSGPFLFWALSIVDRIMPANYDLIFGAGINQRQNNQACCPRKDSCPEGHSVCWSYQTSLDLATQQGISFLEILAIPEQDEWEYCSDGVCATARTCSALATDVLKHSGVFDGYAITASEFVPRDLYQVKLYNTTKQAGCEYLDPELSHCQVNGELKLNLPGWNTIEPYDNMNHKCGCMPYDYIRQPSDC